MHVSIFDLGKGEETFQLSLISFERQLDFDKLASILYDEYRVKLQSVDALVVRPPVDRQFKDEKKDLRDIQRVVERFPHLPVYLLYSSDYKIRLSKNRNKAINKNNDILGGHSEQSLVNKIRQKELEYFILHSASLIRAPENTIYRTPSNEYTHVFVRVGNIQVNRSVLDAIFFWAIPHLKTAGSILTDSWSISSIALNISRLLCRYDKKVKIDKFHVNMLTTHYDGEKKLDRETENNLRALVYENKKDILFLISAVKTQKSLQNIKKAFADLKIANKLEYLAIYKLVERAEIKYLCDLAGDFSIQNDISFDTHITPPNNDEVIEIDDKIFFPIKLKETQFIIKKYCTTANEAFFRKYEGKGVLYIHRNSYYFGKDLFRHHGIYIDVSKMLQCTEFRGAVEQTINQLEKAPQLIIYPPHEHGKDLVNAIKSDVYGKFKVDVECFSVLDIDFVARTDSDVLIKKLLSLSEDDLIMVVDDVSTTGARLKNYQKKLRSVYKGQLHYFVGVARPDKEEKWSKRIRDLIYRPGKAKHIVTSIEKLIIPDWDEKSCPWCCEKNIIIKDASKEINRKFPLTRNLLKRYYSLLERSETGLQNEAFFSINSQPKPKFQGDSIFASRKDISESDLVCIIASAIQNIRNEGGLVLENGPRIKFDTEYPHFKIFKLDDYLGKECSFNEALVRAVILRAASKIELLAKSDQNRTHQLKEVENFFLHSSIGQHEICFFVYEVYLAVKESKLPKPEIGRKLLNLLEDAYNFKPSSDN